jgi:hypothetical protein
MPKNTTMHAVQPNAPKQQAQPTTAQLQQAMRTMADPTMDVAAAHVAAVIAAATE